MLKGTGPDLARLPATISSSALSCGGRHAQHGESPMASRKGTQTALAPSLGHADDKLGVLGHDPFSSPQTSRDVAVSTEPLLKSQP